MNQMAPATIIDFAIDAPEVAVSRPASDRLLGGDPQQITRNYFSDSSGQFFAGVWESTPGRWRVRYSEHEFCHITRGRMRLEDEHGFCREFGPGESFVVAAGFSGIWTVLEPMTKVYAIFEAASK